MREFPIADVPTALPEILAAVAAGESVRLLEEGTVVATVQPPPRPLANRLADPAKSFGEAVAELREKYDLDKNGVTREEVESWRDRSPGREPPF